MHHKPYIYIYILNKIKIERETHDLKPSIIYEFDFVMKELKYLKTDRLEFD
jgi:hypothetical protein